LTKVSVIKIGGATLGSHDTIIEDVVELQRQGKSLVIVHGGAKVVTEWLARQKVPTRFVHGERVTDTAALEMVTAVLGGLVNKELVAAINSRGGQAVGITGIDGNLLQGEIRDKEMGYVARIVKVNTAVLEALVGAGCVPVVAPLSMHVAARADDDPLVLNVNGDTVAGELAAAIGAEKLIFLTDVAGIRDRSGEMITKLSAGDAEALLKSDTVSGGMIPKVRACLRALTRAGEARIIDGREPHALLTEMAGKASGTTIKKDI
jgi:acetylglutamate kinase